MHLKKIKVFVFPVPFRVTFRHASASRSQSENLIVRVESSCGGTGYGEGCPRQYVTGETVAGGVEFIRKHRASLVRDVHDVPSLRQWITSHRDGIDRNPAAFCAVEIAILDLLGRIAEQPIEELVGVPKLCATFGYSAVLGDMPYPAYWWQFHRYRKMGFRDFKIKVSGDEMRDRRKLRVFQSAGNRELRLRLDANNLWDSARKCIDHVKALDHDFLGIEEPLQAGDLKGFRKVAEACGTRVILDESLLRTEQVQMLGDDGPWLINLRVSKMGGIIRALDVAACAAEQGISMIVGAQVGETSILTRAGLTVMGGLGKHLLASEGAFGTYLLREDLTEPCLMFGSGATLNIEKSMGKHAGLGLTIRSHLLTPAPGSAVDRNTTDG